MITDSHLSETTEHGEALFSPEITGPVPIGQSVANYQVLFFDKWLTTSPIGVPGELCIGGPSLARGYQGKPALTAQTFVPNPVTSDPGSRVYRTGDRGYYNSCGEIVFMGRLDRQVKIRGFRIEPGEIEAALASHPQVRQALVMVREDRLDAYVEVGESPAAPVEAGAVMSHVRERLPDFMIPSAIVVMAEFPMTPNRKIDRNNLPDPQGEVQEHYEAPRDSLELQVAEAFAEVLNRPRVGLRENFFEMGGHSLMILNLVSAIRERLDVDLPVPILFQANTVEMVAAFIRDSGAGFATGPLVALKANGSKNPLFLVHAVGGEVVGYTSLSQLMDPERPLYAFEAKGLHGNEQPLDRLEDLAASYIEAMREKQPQGPYLLGGWSLGGVIALEMARQLLAAGETVSPLVMLDTWLSVCDRDLSEADMLIGFMQDRVQLRGSELESVYKAIQQEQPQDHLAFIQSQMEALGREFSDFELARLKRLYQTSSANTRAAAQYKPQPYGQPVFLFQETDHHRQNPQDPRSGSRWRAVAPQVQIRDVPGGHYAMLSHPDHVKVLAQLLNQALARTP